MKDVNAQEEIACLCIYLDQLIGQKNILKEDLANRAGIDVLWLESVVNGSVTPSLDDLVRITNALGFKLTIHEKTSFAHEKILRKCAGNVNDVNQANR